MKWGDLQKLFRGVAWKRLTPHEVDPKVSNGHEFQGVGKLRDLLGTNTSERLPTTYILLQEDSEPEVLELWSKWYDARANNPDRSAEWRLYYPSDAGAIQATMSAGDLMVAAVTRNGHMLIFLAEAGSNRERELEVMFGIADDRVEQLQLIPFNAPSPLDFTTASLLERLGLPFDVEPEGDGTAVIAEIVELLEMQHPEKLPTGRVIADMVRKHVSGIDALTDPDDALFRWLETEAAVYKGWEDRKIARRLREGFVEPDGTADVEAFREFAMALRQSRVSRAGGALQYHIQAVLRQWDIPHVMEPKVDGGESPDFLFPSVEAYSDPEFPAAKLRMLAAKYTAKDRWRQVLNEAARIERKHLLTREPAISDTQRGLMERASLTLVIPEAVRRRYGADAQNGILSVRGFLVELKGLKAAW